MFFKKGKETVTKKHGKGTTEIMCNSVGTFKKKVLTIPAGRGSRDYI